MSKRVKVKASYGSGSGQTYQAGSVYTLDDTEADRLIAAGDAILASDDDVVDPTELAAAVAGATPGPGSIGTAQLADEAVTHAKVDTLISAALPRYVKFVASQNDFDVTNPPDNVGGAPLTAGDRILVIDDGADASKEGIWVWSAAGVACTRPDDFTGTLSGPVMVIVAFAPGNVPPPPYWVCNNGSITQSFTVDTDDLDYFNGWHIADFGNDASKVLAGQGYFSALSDVASSGGFILVPKPAADNSDAGKTLKLDVDGQTPIWSA